MTYTSPLGKTDHSSRGPTLSQWATWLFGLTIALGGLTVSAEATPQSTPQEKTTSQKTSPPKLPQGRAFESADAQWFIAQVNRGLRSVYVASSLAAWRNATHITLEHEARSAARSAEAMAYVSAVIPLAAQFDGVLTDPQTRRQLNLLKRGTTLPAPRDKTGRVRLAQLASKLESMYGQGKTCRLMKGQEVCRDLETLEAVMGQSDDLKTLAQAWEDWRLIARPMRPLYEELVALGNRGAKTLNFNDLGDLWRSQYDMTPQEFEAEISRLWSQVSPLYKDLHCLVRAKLNEKYGDQVVALDQPIPAHLLGNMWAQDWSHLYPLVTPAPHRESIDITAALRAKKYSPLSLTRLAEDFFISLGFDPLPETFWTRSLFEKPTDREVVCHASAWDVHFNNDLRLKMCIKIDQEDLITLHHELGHHYYFQSYYTLPLLLQEGANDGFHEGIGDTLALSVTPAYLHKKGILPSTSEHPEAILNQQMRMGLEKLSFLPFGLLVDRWRWRVFSGEVEASQYNDLWWRLRHDLQGVRPPHERVAEDFDPGAKYHIPGNTPYTRYFIAHILQFQFHRALCHLSGHHGPLHTCSIYGSHEAGARLKAMLSLGARLPWPHALRALTGETRMDAGALLEYFTPLRAYLRAQNKDKICGWSSK